MRQTSNSTVQNGGARRLTSPVFVGRQPIYTRQLDVFAYELLFRSADEAHARIMDGDQATAQILINTFLELGLNTIVGPTAPAFLNFTRAFLHEDFSPVFPPQRVVLEVLEDIPVDADLLAALRRLSARGYLIALDDFIYQPHLRSLVELADIIKIDILAIDRSTLAEHVALLRQYDVKLLAEKVETYEEFMLCKALGFEYFQGYFFCRPNVVKGQRSPTNRLALLNVLTKLQSPDVELRDIKILISRDVSLSYKVLRVANSAFFARARKVESIQQAVALFGIHGITNIVSLLLLSNLDDKPHELLTTALVRANMCERLAQFTQQRNTTAFFTSGLLSVLDAILDRPMPDILAELPLADALDQALRTQVGVLGTTLRSVLAYERGDWEALPALGYSRDMLVDAYLEAIAWADEVQNTL